MERNRQTPAGVPIENRIRSGRTRFYDSEPDALKEASRIRSYVYPCFEEVPSTEPMAKRKPVKKTVLAGYCVPV